MTVVKTQNTTTQEWQLTFQGALGGTNVSQVTITCTIMPPPSTIQATDTQGGTATNEVQTVTLSNATGGTFRLTFGTEQTSALVYNASAGTVETALEALTGIDNVTVTGSAGGPYTITFGGTQANTNVAQITADATFLTSDTLDRTLSFSYDAASQLTQASDPSADYDYTYDNLGRLTAEVQDIAGLTPDIEFAHTWNANSMRTSLASEIGGTADFKNDYTYDNLSRMTQVIQQDVGGGNTVADKRTDFAYNALGQFTSLTRYQSTGTSNLVATSTFTYDTLNRLTDLDHKQNSTNLALYDYAYDAMDRITSMTHSVDGASNYTYDKESQVTAADHPSPNSDESYTYNATGNRTGGSYTNTTNNRTTADATYSYTYDDEGNRSRRTKSSDSSYEDYTWDHRNRLTKVTFKNSGGTTLKTVEYAYDTFNRWLRRTYDADGPGATAATDIFFAYDDKSINASLQFDGAASSDLTNRYLWGPSVDQIMASEEVTSLGSAGNVLWPLTDHLGTTRDLADLNEGNGVTSVTNHRFYDAFGNLKSETNSAVDLIYGFTGKPFDEVTKLQNNWGRIYDAALAQFLSDDPSGFNAGDNNLRRYVENSPPNFSDPNGLVKKPANIPPTNTGGNYPVPTVFPPRKTSPPTGPDPSDNTYDTVAIYDYKDADQRGGCAHATNLWEGATKFPAALPTASPKDIENRLAEYVKKFGPIDKLYILDHSGLDYKQKMGDAVLQVSDFETYKKYLGPNPIIVFGGCQVGANEEYCQEVANTIQGTVIASPYYVQYPNLDADCPWYFSGWKTFTTEEVYEDHGWSPWE